MTRARKVGPRRTTPGLNDHPLNQCSGVRRAWIGQVQHAVITRLAVEAHPGERPTWTEINTAVHRFFVGMPAPTVRGGKIEAMGGVAAWVRYQWPPESWRLLGVEADVSPGGRPDLWWRVGTDVVADEIKSASEPRQAWAPQLGAQIEFGDQRWAVDFLGVRLFLTGNWRRSLWLPRLGPRHLLSESPFWFPHPGRCPDA